MAREKSTTRLTSVGPSAATSRMEQTNPTSNSAQRMGQRIASDDMPGTPLLQHGPEDGTVNLYHNSINENEPQRTKTRSEPVRNPVRAGHNGLVSGAKALWGAG